MDLPWNQRVTPAPPASAERRPTESLRSGEGVLRLQARFTSHCLLLGADAPASLNLFERFWKSNEMRLEECPAPEQTQNILARGWALGGYMVGESWLGLPPDFAVPLTPTTVLRSMAREYLIFTVTTAPASRSQTSSVWWSFLKWAFPTPPF